MKQESNSEHIQNGTYPKWNISKMEHIQNGTYPKWIISKMDHIQNGTNPKWNTSSVSNCNRFKIVKIKECPLPPPKKKTLNNILDLIFCSDQEQLGYLFF